MYIETVPNRNSPPAILLREGLRQGNKVLKRTLANLSDWPKDKIENFRRLLRDEPLVSPRDLFSTRRTMPHGHVEAILLAIRQLGLDSILSAKPGRERNLVLAMLVERILHAGSKLATTRLWHSTTLAEELGVVEATEDDLYRAMDWLFARQDRIEKKLAEQHLQEGGLVLYDVSSSYYEGRTCPLAHYGHDRDGQKGLPIIVYGLLTNRAGCPVAVKVYPGNTADPTTVLDQVDKLRQQFHLERVVLVGDRGMLTQPKIDKLREYRGLGWITALTSTAVGRLLAEGCLQLSLFDEKNLVEIQSAQYPGERLMACYNPLLAEERKRKREDLLQATEKSLIRIVKEAERRKHKLLSATEIAVKVGKLSWQRKQEGIEQEAKLDGIYVIRTSEAAEKLSADDTVRGYKSLSQVERAFRCLKGLDLRIRPIHHRTEQRVPAHIFLCMLAYYVEWHLRRVWAPLLFEDEELPQQRQHRDPVLPASGSESAQEKKASKQTAEGFPVHSFATLIFELGTRARVTYGLKTDESAPSFQQVPPPNPLQARAYELIRLLPVAGN
jgi:transposase